MLNPSRRRLAGLAAAMLGLTALGGCAGLRLGMQKPEVTVANIRLLDGPFRKLEGSWAFKPLGETACKIEFRLRYEFSSKLFEKVIGPVFNHIANTFVDAFVRRAAQVYGPAAGQ